MLSNGTTNQMMTSKLQKEPCTPSLLQTHVCRHVLVAGWNYGICSSDGREPPRDDALTVLRGGMNAVGSWDRSSCNMRVVEDEPQESALMSSTPYRAFIWHSTPMAYHDCW